MFEAAFHNQLLSMYVSGRVEMHISVIATFFLQIQYIADNVSNL